MAKSLNDFLRQCSFSGVLDPLLAQRGLDLSLAYLLTVHLRSNSRALTCICFFEFWNSGQSFNNKSFQEVPSPRAFLRGGEWAESVLEHRAPTALCSALSAKLKVNLLTKSAVNCAVYN